MQQTKFEIGKSNSVGGWLSKASPNNTIEQTVGLFKKKLLQFNTIEIEWF